MPRSYRQIRQNEKAHQDSIVIFVSVRSESSARVAGLPVGTGPGRPVAWKGARLRSRSAPGGVPREGIRLATRGSGLL